MLLTFKIMASVTVHMRTTSFANERGGWRVFASATLSLFSGAVVDMVSVFSSSSDNGRSSAGGAVSMGVRKRPLRDKET